ncbi:MAG: hypothetical protein IPI41_12035 [Flavobacteriales bacterium]|nr:hypothetical protein [Flavobacteriales bacterium]
MKILHATALFSAFEIASLLAPIGCRNFRSHDPASLRIQATCGSGAGPRSCRGAYVTRLPCTSETTRPTRLRHRTERVEVHAVAGWVLLNVKPRGNEAMEALVRGIAKQPGVLFASPVFVDDPGGPMFVTPTVLAAFTGGVGADAKSALLRDVGLTVEQEFPAVGVTLCAAPLRARVMKC